MNIQEVLTDLGDLLCVTAVAGVIAFWCWQQIDRLAAAAFAAAYALTFCVTAGLKMVSANVARSPWETEAFGLSSGAPSGHVAMTMVAYGAAAYFCGKAARGWEALLGQAACLLVIVAVAVTRVTLHDHTIGDVIAGVTVGGLILALPMALVWSRPRPQSPVSPGSTRWLIAGMAAAALFMLASGARMPSNAFAFA